MKLRNNYQRDLNSQIQRTNKAQTQNIFPKAIKKISDMVVNIHSILQRKITNVQIFRELTQQQQQLLISVKNNNQIHVIIAGLFAIDSSLKQIQKQQTSIITHLMKGFTVLIQNFKKVQFEMNFLLKNQNSESLLKFYNNFKFIINLIHKIPSVKFYQNDIERHMKSFENIVKQRNLKGKNRLLSDQNTSIIQQLVKQNNELGCKINELQNLIIDFEKQKKQKLSQKNTMNQLRQQNSEKNQLIIKMNDQFIFQIKKYQKIFQNLTKQNNILKKYSDVDTAYILQELEYEIQLLKKQRFKDQQIILEILPKINQMNCIKKKHINPPLNIEKQQNRFSYDPRKLLIMNNLEIKEQEIQGRCSFMGSKKNRGQNQRRYYSPISSYDQNKIHKDVKIDRNNIFKFNFNKNQQNLRTRQNADVNQIKSSDSYNRFQYKTSRQSFFSPQMNQKRSLQRQKNDQMKRSLLQNKKRKISQAIQNQIKKLNIIQ